MFIAQGFPLCFFQCKFYIQFVMILCLDGVLMTATLLSWLFILFNAVLLDDCVLVKSACMRSSLVQVFNEKNTAYYCRYIVSYGISFIHLRI